MKSRKMVQMSLFSGQQWRNRHREQAYGYRGRGGEERDSKMCGESNMETYNTICKIDSQREFAVCLRELKQGLCINLKRWDGKGGSRGKGHTSIADSC